MGKSTKGIPVDQRSIHHQQWVGPVLQASSPLTLALLDAFRELNPECLIVDKGGYFRVLAFPSCHLTCSAIENKLGRPFRLPQDLEEAMVSFKGKIEILEDQVIWTL